MSVICTQANSKIYRSIPTRRIREGEERRNPDKHVFPRVELSSGRSARRMIESRRTRTEIDHCEVSIADLMPDSLFVPRLVSPLNFRAPV